MTQHRLPWLDTPWEPEALREEPLEQLLERSVEFADATEGLFDKLEAVRASAGGSGIAVTVTLDGRLTELTLSEEALALGGARLAAEIHRLTTEAAADALSLGIAVLTPVVGIEMAAQLAAATGLDEAAAPARRRSAPVGEEDFSTLETWAVRD